MSETKPPAESRPGVGPMSGTKAGTSADAYHRIGVSEADDDETALRKAEVYLLNREQTHRRMGSTIWEDAWALDSIKPLPAIGDIGQVETALALLLGQIESPHAAVVGPEPLPVGACLVLGCGKGYAVAALARSGARTI